MLYRRGTRWWYRFKVNGRLIRGSTRTADRVEAVEFARAALEDYLARNPRRRPRERAQASSSHITWSTLVANHAEAQCIRGVSQETIRGETRTMERIVQLLGPSITPQRFDARDAHRLALIWRNAGYRGQTIRRQLDLIARLLRFGVRNHHIAWLPDTAKWPRPRNDPPSDQRGHLHDAQDVARAIAQMPAPYNAIATIAVMTGLRAREITRLRADWIRLAPPGIGLTWLLHMPAEATKTNTERIIGLVDLARNAILSFVELPDPERWVKAYSQRRAPKGQLNPSLRDLRHCHASWAAADGGAPRAIMAALGHADLHTTTRYLHATTASIADVPLRVVRALEAGAQPGGAQPGDPEQTHVIKH